MGDHDMIDTRKSNGILRSNKAIERADEHTWHIHCFVEGWQIAAVTLDQAVAYMEGEIDGMDFAWY